jgi:ankyrin repeat protein
MFNKWSKLMLAITLNEYRSFLNLINSENLDLEYEDSTGDTALIMASRHGRIKMVKKLIEKGADIFHKNKFNEDFYDVLNNRKFSLPSDSGNYNYFRNLKMKRWIEKNYPEFLAAKKYNL